MGAAVSFTSVTRSAGALALATLLVQAAGCAPGPSLDPAGARAHIRTLTETIGPRPHGSAAAADARDYIVQQLRALGLSVRIQDAESVDRDRGMTARVRNIIAWRDGDTADAIALVSHYDSRPGVPGAIDDALGVAAGIEAARALADPPMRHSLFVLVTDAEELGLMGARALIADPEVSSRVKAVINVEGTGGEGPPLMFETTGGSALAAWTHSFAPVGTSLGTEIYKRMPNDTDFSILAGPGIDGINLAPIGDSYAYHTDRDTSERLSDATLALTVQQAITTVRALDELTPVPGSAEMTYFDLAGRRGVAWGAGAATVVTIGSAVLAALAWLLLAIEGRRRTSLVIVVSTIAFGALVAAGAGAGMLGAAWLVTALRSQVLPWYSAPMLFISFIATTGLLGGWVLSRLIRRLPERVRPWQTASGVWLVGLPMWAVAAGVVHGVAPAASYLITVPLTITALALLLAAKAPAFVRLASLAALVVAALLWAGHALRLVRFLVPLFGWLPVAPPWWLMPAVVGATAWMLAPPVLALLAGRRTVVPFRRGLLLVSLPVLASGLLTLVAPAYSEERPARRTLLYVDDVTSGQAWWEAGGGEGFTDLGDGPSGGGWVQVERTDDLLGTRRLAGFAPPFRYRAAAMPDEDTPPALVRGETVIRPDGLTELTVTIVPRRHVGVEIRLPAGITPVESSLAGRTMARGWAAIHASAPTAGLTARIVTTAGPDALRGATVALATGRLPGTPAAGDLPDWVPVARSTWSFRAVHIVPVFPESPPGG